jgi:DNA-binding transcriptional LysR family regulator
MLNVRHLAVFRAVMQMGTVSGAARMLNVSQPAVTKSLQLLEGHLGVTLFERIKGRLQPAGDSEVLMPEIERLFSMILAVEQAAEEVRHGRKGHVTLATVNALATSLVASAVAEFTAARPRVRFEIHALSTRKVVQEVSNNQVDLGLLDVQLAGGYSETIELCRSETACVVPTSHRLARKTHVTPADLAKERIISFAEDTMTGMLLREAFKSKGVPFAVDVVSIQSMTACALARLGAGVALVDPFPLLLQVPDDLTIIPFRPTIEIKPVVICPPGRPVSTAADQFINTLQSTMKSLIKRSPFLKSV